jgi:hypothetical protein
MVKFLQCFKLFLATSLILFFITSEVPAQGVTFDTTYHDLGIIDDGSMFGCAWGDYDKDGDLDLFIAGNPNKLYQNNYLKFATLDTVLSEYGDIVAHKDDSYATGPAWADYDNDGDLDLLSVDLGLKLYRNDGSSFTDISEATGLSNFDVGYPLWQVCWGDYDKDGDLDIAYAGADPDNDHYTAQPPMRILKNDDGTFIDVAGDLLASTYTLECWNPTWLDVDNDGDLDLWMPVIRTGTSTLFQNTGTSFTDITANSNITATAAIASSWADYDNDGDMDLFIMQYSGNNSLFYKNNSGVFENIAGSLGMAGPISDSRGVCWGDYDNDGDLDLLIGRRNNPQILYQNNAGSFTDVGASTGAGITGDEYRNAVFVDFDNDGFLDIYLNGSNDKRLLHNGGNDNHWIVIKPVGNTSNRDGIGARVRIVTGSVSQIRDIQGGGAGGLRHGYLWAHFGVGSATTVDSVIVRWPRTGDIDVEEDVAVDQFHFFVEDIGITAIGDNPGDGIIPSEYALYQNYPNPFNPTTKIPFYLAQKEKVRIVLVNTLGEVVKEIVQGEYRAGHHEVIFNTDNLATGIYFYKMNINGHSLVKKLVIIK